MGLYRHDGTRITKERFPAAALNDPPVRVTEDVYVSEPYGRGDGQPEGSKRFLLYPAGTVVARSAVDRLFTVATIAATGPRPAADRSGRTPTPGEAPPRRSPHHATQAAPHRRPRLPRSSPSRSPPPLARRRRPLRCRITSTSTAPATCRAPRSVCPPTTPAACAGRATSPAPDGRDVRTRRHRSGLGAPHLAPEAPARGALPAPSCGPRSSTVSRDGSSACWSPCTHRSRALQWTPTTRECACTSCRCGRNRRRRSSPSGIGTTGRRPAPSSLSARPISTASYGPSRSSAAPSPDTSTTAKPWR